MELDYHAPSFLGDVTGTATITVAIGIVKFFLSSLMRTAPSTSVSINGKPVMNQISWKEAFQALAKAAVSISIAAVAFAAVKEIIKKTLDTLFPPSNSNQAAAATTIDTTRYNPYASVLNLTIESCITNSTATSATIYLSGFTATTSVGLAWWNFQNNMASTATGSYQSVFYTTKYFTDALSGTALSAGLMSLDDILDAMKTVTTETADLVITPSISTMAGTLQDANYINSATTAFATIINDANNSSTTYIELTNEINSFETYLSKLVERIDADTTNQALFITQANHLSAITNAATALNNIRDNHTGDVYELYRATLNPALLSAIEGVAALKDLNSSNTGTVAQAVAAFESGKFGSTSSFTTT